MPSTALLRTSTLWDERCRRGRVAEWPVTDPILPVLVLIQDNATAKSMARMHRENREGAGRSDRTRPKNKDEGRRMNIPPTTPALRATPPQAGGEIHSAK